MTAEARDELRLLAALVHRGQLPVSEAEPLAPRLQAGESLDDLLAELGHDLEWIARMRRTNAGEIPEVPGYDIGERLGVGGTAVVWKALERKTQRKLALKVLRPEMAANPAELKPFVEEARLLERLDIPGLVKGYGVARAGKTIFSRLELVPGRTLLEVLDDPEHGAFDEPEALGMVLSCARTLAALEAEGIVHRDLKPGNIMITDDPKKRRVVLIDLGFAATSGAAGKAESGTGTVAYLSPEEARGGAAADSRSDIYSLGVSLFQLVVGRLPFESSDDREVLRMQVMESLSSPELKGRGFTPHLYYFIEKMMAKEKEHRYQSWSALIDDIAGQLEGAEDLDFTRGRSSRRRRR
jgi:serine/threonine-protein kinase